MPDTKQRFFAAYAQAVEPSTGQRVQWFVFPPVMQEVDGFKLIDAPQQNALLLTRRQSNASHRATWDFRIMPAIDPEGIDTVSNGIRDAERRGWEVSPLITIGVNIAELKAVFDREKEAHHKLLERVSRVASRRHRITI